VAKKTEGFDIMKTLVISGSIRSREKARDHILSGINNGLDSLPDYVEYVTSFQKRSGPTANSDILSGAVLLGMKTMGAEVDCFSLKKLFPRREKRLVFRVDEHVDADLGLTDTLALNENILNDLMQKT